MAEQTKNKMPGLNELKGRRIGRILTKMGKVTRDQVNEALALQEKNRAPLGQLLVELGYVNHDDVNLALAGQAHRIAEVVLGRQCPGLDELEDGDRRIGRAAGARYDHAQRHPHGDGQRHR